MIYKYFSFQVSQEMGIIEKEEDYVNPYKKQAKKVGFFSLFISLCIDL